MKSIFDNAVFKIKLKKRRIYFAGKEKICNFETYKRCIKKKIIRATKQINHEGI